MDLSLLRESLQPLSSGLQPKSNLYQQYLEHYQLNITDEGLAERQIMGTVVSDQFTAVGQVFYSQNAVGNILVIHGFMDHTGLYGHLIRCLLKVQLNVVCIDLPGHGLSSGKRASIDSFFDYTNTLEQLLTDTERLLPTLPWYITGQSMGGALSMTMLIKHAGQFEKSLLLAPLVQPAQWPLLRYVHSAAKRWLPSIPRHFKGNSHDESFNLFLSTQDKLQTDRIPVAWISAMRKWRSWLLDQEPQAAKIKVIQGSNDATIDWPFGNQTIAQLFPHSEIELIPDAMHHLINESDVYRTKILNQVSNFFSSN